MKRVYLEILAVVVEIYICQEGCSRIFGYFNMPSIFNILKLV